MTCRGSGTPGRHSGEPLDRLAAHEADEGLGVLGVGEQRGVFDDDQPVGAGEQGPGADDAGGESAEPHSGCYDTLPDDATPDRQSLEASRRSWTQSATGPSTSSATA